MYCGWLCPLSDCDVQCHSCSSGAKICGGHMRVLGSAATNNKASRSILSLATRHFWIHSPFRRLERKPGENRLQRKSLTDQKEKKLYPETVTRKNVKKKVERVILCVRLDLDNSSEWDPMQLLGGQESAWCSHLAVASDNPVENN